MLCYILDMAYYHIYRPQNFKDIEDTQPDVASFFRSVLAKDALSHVYLFVGSHGIGKTSVARILSRAVNCEKKNEGGNKKNVVELPCNECGNCKSILEGNFPDVYELDAASNRGIDEIRKLQEIIRLSPTLGSKKVYIIDEVHMLTNEAFNALLKTFEEPPSERLFILCTTELHKVPLTIKSRSSVVEFSRPSEMIISKYLLKIAAAEKISIDEDSLVAISKAAQGAFRDAAKLLEQVAAVDSKITLDHVSTYLHLGTKEHVTNFSQSLLQGNLNAALEITRSLEKDQVNPQLFLKDVLAYLRIQLHGKVQGIPEASSIHLPTIVKIIDSCHSSLNGMKQSPMPYLVLELGICSLTIKQDVVELPKEPKNVVSPAVNNKDVEPIKAIKEVVANNVEVTPVQVVAKPEIKALGPSVVPAEDVIMPAADIMPTRDNPPEFQEIKTRWKELVSLVKDSNASVASVLRTSQPVNIEGKAIHISITYRFHKDRLESVKNRQLVESALYELFGIQLKLVCVLATQTNVKKKDLENVQEVADEGLVEAALEIFAS